MGPMLCAFVLAASAQTFMITWSGRDSAAAKAAGQSANFWGSTLANLIGQQLDAKYPCGSTMDQAAAAALLDNERKRWLLGADEDPGRLAAIGGAVGARTVIHITVTMMGGESIEAVVKVAAVDTVTAKTVAHRVEPIPIDDNPDIAIKRLAAEFVGSLAGGVPKCKGRDWAGNVTIAYEAKGTSADRKYSEDGSGSLVCQLSGDGPAAKCTYSSTFNQRGTGGTITWKKTAKDADNSVSASVSGGKLKLAIGAMRVRASMNGPGVTIEPTPEDLGAESYEVPAGPDPNRQAGTFSPPALGTVKVTVSWDLSRPAAGAR